MFTLPRGAELIIILFLAILLFGRGRIGNIFKELGKGLKDFRDAQVDVNLLSHDAEIKLFSALENIKLRVEKGIAEKDFNTALNKLAALRPPVDNFFDHVMVMDKDEKIRTNRLALLSEISALFHKIADFSKIVTAG